MGQGALLGARLWAPVATLAALALSGPTFAADPRDEARVRLRAGVVLMERGDYAGALAEFEAAYARFPSPKLQFNIGTAYDALARYAAAHEAFSRFLADPRDAPAETVAKARAAVEGLDKKVGRIAVTSDQADDRVFVDGRPRGVTPLARPIVVDPGAHAVMVERGEAQYAENVALGEGEARSVAARFVPAVAAVPEAAPPPTVSPPERVEPAASMTLERTPAPPVPAPFYRRVWFWSVVAGGLVAAGVGAALLLRSTEYPSYDSTVTIPMP